MLNYFHLLSSILDNHPNRLLISPSEKKIVASFGNSESIKLEDYSNYDNFKNKVLSMLKKKKIGFGSISFDISNNKKEEIWKEYPNAEFIFPSYTLIFDKEKIKEFGKNKNIYENIISSTTQSNFITNKVMKTKEYNYDLWVNLVEKAKDDISNSKLEKIVVGESREYSNTEINLKQTLLK